VRFHELEKEEGKREKNRVSVTEKRRRGEWFDYLRNLFDSCDEAEKKGRKRASPSGAKGEIHGALQPEGRFGEGRGGLGMYNFLCSFEKKVCQRRAHDPLRERGNSCRSGLQTRKRSIWKRVALQAQAQREIKKVFVAQNQKPCSLPNRRRSEKKPCCKSRERKGTAG